MTKLPFDPSRIPEGPLSIPELPDAKEGWRAFDVVLDTYRWDGEEQWRPRQINRDPVLRSVGGHFIYEPRKINVAECRAGCVDIPGEHCSCGFYSAKNLPHLQSMGYHQYHLDVMVSVHVIGQVAYWGKVIEGSQGWRAAKCYPVRLFVPYEAWKVARPLSAAYGVPVKLKNTLNEKLERSRP